MDNPLAEFPRLYNKADFKRLHKILLLEQILLSLRGENVYKDNLSKDNPNKGRPNVNHSVLQILRQG
jgi:hypothetical protein